MKKSRNCHETIFDFLSDIDVVCTGILSTHSEVKAPSRIKFSKPGRLRGNTDSMIGYEQSDSYGHFDDDPTPSVC